MRFTKEQKIAIVCEQVSNETPIKEITAKYNISKQVFFIWKREMFGSASERMNKERANLEYIKPRVILRGQNKNFFLADCTQRDWSDSKMLRNIVDVYYSIQANIPELKGKEMTEIKKLISERIKL